jgi:hypothetical protein
VIARTSAPLDAAAVATSVLAPQEVTLVEVNDGFADLILELSGSPRLEIISTSCGYESWRDATPSGFHVIAQGGGQLSDWPAAA